jgi:hypothetical protein
MAFLLIMSTFLQVNRFTTKPSRVAPNTATEREPEIGG